MGRKTLMATTISASNTKKVRLPYRARAFFNILKKVRKGSIKIIHPSGDFSEFKGELKGIDVTLNIHNWDALDMILGSGDIGLGESFRQGMWSCAAIDDLIAFGIENQKYLEKIVSGSFVNILYYRFKHFLNRNNREGSKKNIHAHYDLGNDFYESWLDDTMTYSSALFLEKSDDLQQAQKNKYQRILRKLDAYGGRSILEIGCGWGGFLQEAADAGLHVTGITISKEQFEYCREKFKNNPLVEIKFCDYRDMKGQFDYVVSIEMFEALGKEYWSRYFEKIREILVPGGRAVIQTIEMNDEDFKSYSKGSDFIQQMIFPGGMLPCPKLFKEKAKESGLRFKSRFRFGQSYAETLRNWDKNYTAQKEKISLLGFDEKFHRLWHFYLKYCEGGFRAGKIDVSHYVLEK